MPYFNGTSNGKFSNPEAGTGDANPNLFAPAGGAASQSEIYDEYARPLPEQTDLFMRHMDYLGFRYFLKTIGYSEGVSTPTVGHYEMPWDEQTFTVSSIITSSTGPGTSVVVAIDPTDMYTSGATVSSSARPTSRPRVHDIVLLHDGTTCKVTAKNVTTNPHRLTLTPVSTAVDLATQVVSTETYSISHNDFPEGSGLPEPILPRFFKYTNTFGIIKERTKITGSELTNSIYHAQPGSGAGQSIVVSMDWNATRRFESSMSKMYLFGQQHNNITFVNTDLNNIDMTTSGTEGFLSFAETGGNDVDYSSGAFATSDLQALADVYLDNRSTMSSDILGFVGPTLSADIENAYTAVLDGNYTGNLDRLVVDEMKPMLSAAASAKQDYKSGDLTIAFGYRAIKTKGFVFHLKNIAEFADIQAAGGAGYEHRQWGVWAPYDWYTDRGTGRKKGAIGYEYKALNGYSREVVTDILPGAGVGGNTSFGKPVTQFDSLDRFWLHEGAAHIACGNALTIMKPV